MGVRMNGVMNSITNSDGEYQEIIRKSDEYSNALDKMELPKEVRRLTDGYVSEQSALGSRYGMLAYLLGFFRLQGDVLGEITGISKTSPCPSESTIISLNFSFSFSSTICLIWDLTFSTSSFQTYRI